MRSAFQAYAKINGIPGVSGEDVRQQEWYPEQRHGVLRIRLWSLPIRHPSHPQNAPRSYPYYTLYERYERFISLLSHVLRSSRSCPLNLVLLRGLYIFV